MRNELLWFSGSCLFFSPWRMPYLTVLSLLRISLSISISVSTFTSHDLSLDSSTTCVSFLVYLASAWTNPDLAHCGSGGIDVLVYPLSLPLIFSQQALLLSFRAFVLLMPHWKSLDIPQDFRCEYRGGQPRRSSWFSWWFYFVTSSLCRSTPRHDIYLASFWKPKGVVT